MTLAIRFAKLSTFLRKHRKLVVFGLVMFGFFAYQYASAQGVPGAPSLINLMLVGLGVIYNVFAWAFGQLIVLTIGMVLIPILGYNNFADSHVINIAWPLVRDVMNMGVILVLLLIAIQKMIGGDIPGVSKVGVDQALPRLFIGVVALNFSRTICILAIDASQVVMFTFVNALRDIAAGNFAGLFNVHSLLSVNQDVIVTDLIEATGTAAAAASDGLNAFSYLGTAYATVALLGAVLAVMLIIAVVFIYRIVILWVLVITSPVAFFMIVMQPLIPFKIPVADWMTRFTGAVTLGPILVFFLWLSLAAAGTGSIAAAENFPSATTDDVTGFLTRAFEMDQIMSLFIGIILLMVGLQMAQGAAGQLGSFAAQSLGKARGAARAAIKLPASATVGFGRAGVVGAKRGAQAVDARYGVSAGFAKDLSTFGNRSFGGPDAGIASRAINAGIQGAAGGIGGYARGQRKDINAAAKKTVGGYTDEYFTSQARLLAQKPDDAKSWAEAIVTPGAQQRFREIGYQVVSDKKREGQLLASLENQYRSRGLPTEDAKKEVEQIKRGALAVIGDPEDYFGDDANAKKNWKSAQMRNLHLLDEGAAQKLLKDPEANIDDMSTEAIQDPKVWKMLQDETYARSSKTDRATGLTVPVTLADQIENGKNAKLRNAARGEGAGWGDAPHIIANAVKNNYLDPQDINPEHIENPEDLKRVAAGLAMSGKSMERLGQRPDPETGKKLSIRERGQLIQAFADLSDDEGSPVTEAQYKKAAFSAMSSVGRGNDAAQEILDIKQGAVGDQYKNVVRQIVADQPTQVYKFATQVKNHGASDLTKLMTEEGSKGHAENMKKLVDQAAARVEQADPKFLKEFKDEAQALRKKIADGAEAMEMAIEAELAKQGFTTAQEIQQGAPKEVKDKLYAYRAARRYASPS